MAEEAMRGSRLVRDGRPRRDDAEIAIDLHGIGVDDNAAKPFGYSQRQRRFAAGGRACNQDGSGPSHPTGAIRY
jgi:hypothetical protein